MIKKCVVYLFDDVPLQVVVINSKGKILDQKFVQWNANDKTLDVSGVQDEEIIGR